jgi:hypothetical protein
VFEQCQEQKGWEREEKGKIKGKEKKQGEMGRITGKGLNPRLWYHVVEFVGKYSERKRRLANLT